MKTFTHRLQSSDLWPNQVAVGIKGVSLHSYRYAWAERAKTAGYPERYAQVNLGHNSKAMTRDYSRKAEVAGADFTRRVVIVLRQMLVKTALGIGQIFMRNGG